MKTSTTIFTVLGNLLDSDCSVTRWQRWRPTVALALLPDFQVDTLEVIHQQQHSDIAYQVKADVEAETPTRVRLHLVTLDDPWNFVDVYAALFDVATNFRFLDTTNYYVHLSTGTHTMQICLFLLTETRYFPARLLQTKPPDDRNTVHSESFTEIDLDLAQYQAIAQRFEKRQKGHLSYLKSGINTSNERYNELIQKIEYVALNSVAPLLLSGATGAGKTQLAQRIYALKKQAHQIKGKFVEVNCSTLTRDTASSTLFGHTKGAFTGAQSARGGLLKTADRGLLFLDEIGELGLDEQTLLLKAIEEKRFMPLGADGYEASDFQLIAGTNRDLWQEVREKRFREDLLARINLWTFELPNLKDRPEDIAPNIDYELEQFARKHKQKIAFSKPALQRFLTFARSPQASWRANFRDLNAAVERMATFSQQGLIEVATVEEEIERLSKSWQKLEANVQPPEMTKPMWEQKRNQSVEHILPNAITEGLDHIDKHQLNEVIRVCRQASSLSHAGRTLFDQSRTRRRSHNDADRLRKYLSKYGLTFDDVNDQSQH